MSPSTAPDADQARALLGLSEVLDPEVGENIVDLGLVERLAIDADSVTLTLLLTSATCPMRDAIAEDAFRALQRALPDRDVYIDHAQGVAWGPERMSAGARQRLGWNDDAP